MKYPGGKNSAGTYQRIINQIPPHRVYLEGCAGSGAILRLKRPAERSIAIDLDAAAIAALGGAVLAMLPAFELIEVDFVGWLFEHGREIETDWFVYCDPPYLPETCLTHCRYRHGMSDLEHGLLLEHLRSLPCPVMVSGRQSPMYAEMLAGWRQITFSQISRGGYAIEESLWMNYPEPLALHDYRYLGGDYRQRENFAKRRRRWTAKLGGMSSLERRALLAAMRDVDLVSSAETAVAAHTAKPGGAVRTAGNGVGIRASSAGGSGGGRRRPPRPAAAAAATAGNDGMAGHTSESGDGGPYRRQRRCRQPVITARRKRRYRSGLEEQP